MARTKYEINYTWLSCCGRWLLSPAHVLNKKQPHRYIDTNCRCRYTQTESAGKCVCCDILQVICWLNFQSEWRARSFGAGWGGNGCGRGCGTRGRAARLLLISEACNFIHRSSELCHWPFPRERVRCRVRVRVKLRHRIVLMVCACVWFVCVCALFNSR